MTRTTLSAAERNAREDAAMIAARQIARRAVADGVTDPSTVLGDVARWTTNVPEDLGDVRQVIARLIVDFADALELDPYAVGQDLARDAEALKSQERTARVEAHRYGVSNASTVGFAWETDDLDGARGCATAISGRVYHIGDPVAYVLAHLDDARIVQDYSGPSSPVGRSGIVDGFILAVALPAGVLRPDGGASHRAERITRYAPGQDPDCDADATPIDEIWYVDGDAVTDPATVDALNAAEHRLLAEAEAFAAADAQLGDPYP